MLSIKKYIPDYLKIVIKYLYRYPNAKIALIKSLYYSLAFDGGFVLSRYAEIYAQRTNFFFHDKNSSLLVGLFYYSPLKITVIECHKQAKFFIQGKVSLHRGCLVVVRDQGILKIGTDTYLSEGCKVTCRELIEIGENCAIAWGVQIIDTDEHSIIWPDQTSQSMTAPIRIENHVWIGCNAIILKGVTIGENSIVAAGSVVTRDVLPNSLVAGNPAKVIRENVNWK